LVPSEFLVIPTRIDADEASSDVEPPRLLAAAVEPHTSAAESDIPPVAEPLRRGRSRTDTMVFSEGLNMAEELMKGEELGIPNVSEPDGDAESAAPGNEDSFDMPASIELEDAGIPLATHELATDEGLHPSAAEHPESSVDPSLARSPELAVSHDFEDVSESEVKDNAPESRDVTEDEEVHEYIADSKVEDQVDDKASEETADSEHAGEEADVTDEPLHGTNEEHEDATRAETRDKVSVNDVDGPPIGTEESASP
jgi:hypothetical protein